jgi:hypothetical protein
LVEEQVEGRTVWFGTVEVFALTGHRRAKRCYAWEEAPDSARRQIVTVLQTGLIIFPETAVKAWLAFKRVTIDLFPKL